jgi:hypothetical protein
MLPEVNKYSNKSGWLSGFIMDIAYLTCQRYRFRMDAQNDG